MGFGWLTADGQGDQLKHSITETLQHQCSRSPGPGSRATWERELEAVGSVGSWGVHMEVGVAG